MKNYLFPVVLLLLFFAACTPTDTAEPGDVPQEDVTGEVAEDVAEAPSDEEEEVAEPSATALDELMDLFDAQASLEYQVEYDMVVVTGGERMESTMTQFMKGENIRMDMSMDGMESRTIMTPTLMTSCLNQGNWMCFDMELGEEDDSWNAEEFREDFEEDPDAYDVSLDAPRTIAGKLATCFSILTDDAETNYCLSKEGVPLYVHFAAEGVESTMMATSYSTSVPNNAFEAPADAGSMEDMMGGFDPSAYQ